MSVWICRTCREEWRTGTDAGRAAPYEEFESNTYRMPSRGLTERFHDGADGYPCGPIEEMVEGKLREEDPPSSKIGRDMLLAETTRALRAAYGDRGDLLASELARLLPPEGIRVVMSETGTYLEVEARSVFVDPYNRYRFREVEEDFGTGVQYEIIEPPPITAPSDGWYRDASRLSVFHSAINGVPRCGVRWAQDAKLQSHEDYAQGRYGLDGEMRIATEEAYRARACRNCSRLTNVRLGWMVFNG